MVNLQELLIKLVAELKTSEFQKAVEKSGLSSEEVLLILDLIDERGE